MENILVTGGAGFIGSHFINELLSKDADVQIVNFDKLTYAANLDNLAADDRLMTVQGDLNSEEDLRQIFTAFDFDRVINFAAETHVDNSISNPHLFTEVNTLGFQKLLYAAMEHGIEQFIQISTDEVYGPNRLDRPFVESDPLMADNPYSVSKAGAEMVMKSVENTFGYKGIIIRPSNNYGAHQYPEKLIPLSIKRLLEGGKIGLYGSGLQQRDWLAVEDNVEMIYRLMHKGVKGETYNICTEVEWSNRDIVRLLIDKVNALAGTDFSFEEHVEFVPDRKGHDFKYTLSHMKLIDTVGPHAFRRFEEHVGHTVQAFLTRYGVI